MFAVTSVVAVLLHSNWGLHLWSLDGSCEKVVCGACGTMHQLNEQHGLCRVTALAGPLASFPLVTKGFSTGEEYQAYEWPSIKADWRPVGQHPGGIKALGQLACSRCGRNGKMISLEWMWSREQCPLCSGPMECVYDDTVN